MQLQTVISNQINQARFNKRVNVFELDISKICKLSVVLFKDLVQRRSDLAGFLVTQHCSRFKGVAVSNTATHIDFQQSPIKLKRAIKLREAFIGLAFKTAAPKVF